MAACGEPSAPATPGTPGIHILGGANATDTVLRTLSQPLVAEVRDERGKLVVGAVVRFETEAVPDSRYIEESRAYVTVGGSENFWVLDIDTTDARGQVSTRVRLGTHAGPAHIYLAVPALGLRDTVTYTVLPDFATHVRALPNDTAVYVGKSFSLRGAVLDGLGNARGDPVTYTTSNTATIAIAGDVVTATAIGRAMVVAHGLEFVDTAYVSVVPPGTLAAVTDAGIVVVNTDGSGRRVLTPLLASTTDWSPGGTEVAFDGNYNGPLRVVDLAGSVRTLVAVSTGAVTYPEFSADGVWIYYSFGDRSLRRVKPDGTGDEEFLPALTNSITAPTVSPDGTQLVYAELLADGAQLRLLMTATGASTPLNVRGQSPSWSPLGDKIAFIDPVNHALRLMNPDGTAVRTLSTGQSYAFGIDWSPDGKWIVARNLNLDRGELDLVSTQTADVLPLRFSAGMRGPSWKP
jgi:hypothetical protein